MQADRMARQTSTMPQTQASTSDPGSGVSTATPDANVSKEERMSYRGHLIAKAGPSWVFDTG